LNGYNDLAKRRKLNEGPEQPPAKNSDIPNAFEEIKNEDMIDISKVPGPFISASLTSLQKR
jgi:hypothetical protein